MFRFTIRDVLWLMVVVALGVGWHIDRSQLQTTITLLKSDQQHLRDKIDVLSVMIPAESEAMMRIRQSESP